MIQTAPSTALDPDVEPPASPEPAIGVSGAALSDEELAAVTALIGILAATSDSTPSGAGGTGPTDRALQRRRRLGLWGRPGPDSWKHAAGLR